MAAFLEIHLLGHPKIFVQGQLLQLKAPPRTLPLWAYLLLNRDGPVTRQSLAFLLWPNEPEPQARTNLRRHLYQLRKALPPASQSRPWLIQEGESLYWNPEADHWLDVAEFERLAADETTLERAVEHYQGDLLADLYDDWIFYERERLRNLYASCLQSLMQRERARREYTKAILYSRQLLAHDPLREDTARQLIALRYEAGDRAGALHEYETFLQRLRAELGVDPMPETVAVYEAVNRNLGLPDVALATETSLSAAPHSEPGLFLPFVGRDAEMHTLKTWWSRAGSGEGRLVLISGEAGVGKSRLVEEFLRQADEQGGRILKGRTFSLEPAPYQVIASALRVALPMLAALEIDPVWLAAAAELIPELRQRRGQGKTQLPILARLDPEGDRERLFEGIARCLAGLSHPRPVILVLEDLHLAGSGTLALLEALIHRVRDHRILILATYRQEETTRSHPLRDLRRRLQNENQLTHMSLSRLAPAAVTSLIEQLSGLQEDSLSLADWLYATSEGNPLFLLELIRNLMETGGIRVSAGHWKVSSDLRASIPAEVNEIIIGRLDRLPPAARTLAQVTAIIGPAFNIELAREVSGWDEPRVLDALDDLLDHQLVREAEGGGRFDFTFSHHLVQAAIYNQTPESTRARRHRRTAVVLEELLSESQEDLATELARHYDLGGDPGRAAGYYYRSAKRAQAAYADEEALAACSRALGLTTSLRLSFDLLILREEIHHRRGEREAQQEDLRQLMALRAELEDPDAACEVLYRQIRLHRALGDRQAEGEQILALKKAAPATGKPLWQATALQVEAAYQEGLSQYDQARLLLEEALPLFRELGDIEGQVRSLCLLARVDGLQSRFDSARSHLERAEILAGAESDRSLLIRTLDAASRAAFNHRDFPTSLALGARLLSVCQAISHREGEADAHARMASALARLYRISEARHHYDLAARQYAELGKLQGQAAVLLNAGMLSVNLGRYGEGIEKFQRAEVLFDTMNDARGLTLSALNTSAAAIFSEDFDLAASAARRSLELARKTRMPFVEAIAMGNLGEAELNRGHTTEAIAYLEAALDLRKEQDLPPEESAADMSVLAIAYLHAGDLKKAQQVSNALHELYADKAETLPYPQQALWALAQVWRAVGDDQRAQEMLGQAYQSLKNKAGSIPEPESRVTFTRLPFNRQILAAYEEDLWPQAG